MTLSAELRVTMGEAPCRSRRRAWYLMGAPHADMTEVLRSFEERHTSPDLVRRYWSDLQLGSVSAIESDPSIASLLQEPQELAPLLSELKGNLSRNSAFGRLMLAVVPSAPAERVVLQEPAVELVYRGLNYLSLLDALTLELDRNPKALRALLIGRLAEIVSHEIPYENFFAEAKCKGVYWALHLSSEAAGELVSRESAALLLHANITMAVLSESLGAIFADAGQENAACGYLLAGQVVREGFRGLSTDWRSVYHSWNAAFMLNSPCPNMDSAKIAATALLLPSLVNAGSPDTWLRRRAISLLLALISSFHPDSSLRVGPDVADSVPLSNSSMRRWAEANRGAARDLGLGTSHGGGAPLSEMTRLTPQARAMERFLGAMRKLDADAEITAEEGRRHAVELAATWRKLAGLTRRSMGPF